mmetsp:Transcript_466/g.1185  ORF Transcript_466/g.1185 Transcript_466/m.1185 type:complete len:227 (+) Transcript_466:456-1136(+)
MTGLCIHGWLRTATTGLCTMVCVEDSAVVSAGISLTSWPSETFDGLEASALVAGSGCSGVADWAMSAWAMSGTVSGSGVSCKSAGIATPGVTLGNSFSGSFSESGAAPSPGLGPESSSLLSSTGTAASAACIASGTTSRGSSLDSCESLLASVCFVWTGGMPPEGPSLSSVKSSGAILASSPLGNALICSRCSTTFNCRGSGNVEMAWSFSWGSTARSLQNTSKIT